MELSGLRIGALEHMLPESERHRLMDYVKLSIFFEEHNVDDGTECPKCRHDAYTCMCLHNEAVTILDMLAGIV